MGWIWEGAAECGSGDGQDGCEAGDCGSFSVRNMAAKTSVAVMGLGLMGSGMASRLLGHGFDVTVFNRSAQKAEALAALGAKVAKTPGEAASGAMFVISMLADDGAAREVWLGKDGAMKNVNRDAGTDRVQHGIGAVGEGVVGGGGKTRM